MSREIMQQAFDALNTCDWDYDYDEESYKTFDKDLVNAAAAALEAELAKPEQEPQIPTKIFAPNLEQILNAAGFYRRDAVCCGDYEKCIEPCTPKGEWLAKKEFTKEAQLPPVDIGVDVTPESTHVVACYNRPDAVQEMFYSQFHPLAKPEQEFKYTEYGLRGDENGKLSIGEISRKPWVGLTDEEIEEAWGNTPMILNARDGGARKVFARAIESRLKEKNGAV